MASKPYITLTTCESGDWEILEVDYGETFRASGHSISNHNWIDLLKELGHKVERKIISDEEMEQIC